MMFHLLFLLYMIYDTNVKKLIYKKQRENVSERQPIQEAGSSHMADLKREDTVQLTLIMSNLTYTS